MLVYTSTKQWFLDDVMTNDIDNIIDQSVQEKLNRRTWKSEKLSWKNSLMFMNNILNDNDIPSDCWIAIEYQIPQTSNRVDFIISWKDQDGSDQVIIVELKQWSESNITDKDAMVETRFWWRLTETVHPSYQAWSYASLIKWYNEVVYTEDIHLKPCAYLHNYEVDWNIDNAFYSDRIEKAPLFLKKDAIKLQSFIKEFVKFWDNKDILYRIEKWRIRPSKSLADTLSSMLKWNEEFVMIDEQKMVYETALKLARESNPNNMNTLIVEWWPWTWKSVVAINLLVKLTGEWLVAKYITKNWAPRAVYESKLTWTMKKTEFSNMFSWSWSFTTCPPNTFDALIVDEAHRLNEKSWLFAKWENQIKEIMLSSNFSIFFIDEDQKVHFKDIWEKEAILDRAKKHNVNPTVMELTSQFRCWWSNGYLSWIDNILQIRTTANETLEDINYDFKIFDDPNELRDEIVRKNTNNKARIVAWYCRERTKKDETAKDIKIPEHNFEMKRNLFSDWPWWIIKPESVHEAWCIHTSQWLELEYIWVIFGKDLTVRNWRVLTHPENRARTDKSLSWFKKLLKEDEGQALEKAEMIIKNTYRTLMTRWMKWCYVYFEDKETAEYFKNRM